MHSTGRQSRTWLQISVGTNGQRAVAPTLYINYKNILRWITIYHNIYHAHVSVIGPASVYKDGYTILKSDWINNMDNIHFSGIIPLSVITFMCLQYILDVAS